ncbi:hypothetical protein SprV_0902706700 [Sparganum proliferum]
MMERRPSASKRQAHSSPDPRGNGSGRLESLNNGVRSKHTKPGPYVCQSTLPLLRPSYPHWDIDYDYGDLFDHDYEDDRYKGGEMLFVAGVALLCFGVIFVVIGGICVSCACCSREAAHRHEEYPAEPLQQPTQPPYKPQPQYPSQPQYPPQPQYQPQPQFPTQRQNPPAVAAPLPYSQQPPSYEQVVNTQQHAAYPTAPSAPAADEIKKTVYE